MSRAANHEARRHVPCGAKIRKGLPRRLLSRPGRARCKFQGGKSRGPRTAEGRERIAKALGGTEEQAGRARLTAQSSIPLQILPEAAQSLVSGAGSGPFDASERSEAPESS
jgi:hypothetical protein